MKLDRLFYAPDVNAEFYELSDFESKHCIKVLRLKKGDEIVLNDGVGSFYYCNIFDDNPKKCTVQVIKKVHTKNENPVNIHVAIAPTKNIDRFEWFVEKATEIGISEITPIICDRSERKNIKLDRVEKILVSAMKQSLKAYLPKLNQDISFSDFIKNYSDSNKYIAHCNSNTKDFLKTYPKGKDVLVLIGPEGDFSDKEIEMALSNNYEAISLGKTRLRTETAGIVVCDMINILNSI